MITERFNLVPEEVIESLRRVNLFKGLPEDELRVLVENLKGVKAGPGDELFAEGDTDDKFYVVTEGSVEIVKHVPAGGEEKLAVRRAGEVFGEMALLNDAPRFATARTVKGCECLTLSRGDFERLMGGDSLALRMMKILSQALRALWVRFVNIDRGGAGPEAAIGARSARPARSLPRLGGFDLAVGSAPSLSGIESSAWEALRFADDQVGLVALTIQGDRVPPLHQLAVARAFCTEFSREGVPPETLFPRVNDSLYRNQLYAADQFVAAGMLVPKGDVVLWSNAGGIQGAVIREDGQVHDLADHGPPLGMMAGFEHEVEEIPMNPGDRILIFSGGSQGLFRGAVQSLSSLPGTTAGEVVERIQQAIRGARESDPDEPTILFLCRL